MVSFGTKQETNEATTAGTGFYIYITDGEIEAQKGHITSMLCLKRQSLHPSKYILPYQPILCQRVALDCWSGRIQNVCDQISTSLPLEGFSEFSP